MRRPRLLALIASLALIVGAACGGSTTAGGGGSSGGGGGGASGGGSGDLLQVVKDRGTLLASTDPAYPPQSFQNKNGDFEGFDIDVIKEIAKRLGVDVEYVTPSFDAITAGGWGGRWDVSVGSITITAERKKALYFTPPYYYTPAAVAVHESNTDIQDLSTDLDGKKIGVCQACSYEFYLKHEPPIVGGNVDFIIDNPVIQTYSTDTVAIQDLAIGDGVRLDAAISALPTLQQAIKNGSPIKIVGDPLYYEPIGVAVDKNAPNDPKSFFHAVSKIIVDMHKDGTLTQLSKKWYGGTDLTVKQ